jgi:hypothetical protein
VKLHKNRPKVYIETSVISYYTNKISRDLKIAADQILTRDWWEIVLPKLEPYISEYVLLEIGQGNSIEATIRKQAVKGFESISETQSVVQLAENYLKRLPIPKKAKLDAYHLAAATIFGMDFLVSWNCKHIANAFMIKPIQKINDGLGLPTPVICVPTELMEVLK